MLLLLCFRKAELQSATFGANEAQCHLSELQVEVDRLATAADKAREGASAAAGALEACAVYSQSMRMACLLASGFVPCGSRLKFQGSTADVCWYHHSADPPQSTKAALPMSASSYHKHALVAPE